ncbi:hypothetical protein D3C75_1291330 [compost metagenome]
MITSPAARVIIALPNNSPVATKAVIGVDASTVPFTVIAICEPTPAVILIP